MHSDSTGTSVTEISGQELTLNDAGLCQRSAKSLDLFFLLENIRLGSTTFINHILLIEIFQVHTY